MTVKLNSNLVKNVVSYDNITNCITEIPQDIKLELKDSVLTLKAGSKVYIPNGFEANGVTPKFDVKIIESDISLTQGWGSSQTFLLFYNTNGLRLRIYDTGRCYSGTTSVSDGAYYNTNDNKLYVYDNGSLNFSASLPIAIITGQAPTITSIDQVFNGFGYIGSTIFALPGVKGLIPNGRNADGSLKNIELTNNTVKTVTTSYTINNGLVVITVGGLYEIDTTTWDYDENENLFKNTSGQISKHLILASASYTSGVVSNFTPKTAFRAMDYNDFKANTAWVNNKFQVVSTLPANPDANVFYYIPEV